MRCFDGVGNMRGMVRTPTPTRVFALLGVAWVTTACATLFGGVPGGDAPRPEPIPTADPGYPTGYRRWPTADAAFDEGTGLLHRLYRAPDVPPDRRGRFGAGAVLVKEHVVPGEDDLVVRVDVRRRLRSGTYGGWEYESYDAASHKKIELDAEACDLCHQTAPDDGTFTRFPSR